MWSETPCALVWWTGRKCIPGRPPRRTAARTRSTAAWTWRNGAEITQRNGGGKYCASGWRTKPGRNAFAKRRAADTPWAARLLSSRSVARWAATSARDLPDGRRTTHSRAGGNGVIWCCPSFNGLICLHPSKPDILLGMRTLSLSVIVLFASGAALAQNPDGGRATFETRCARCHGGNATGGESGPNIVAQIAARSDTELAGFLRQGRPANGMPAFDLPGAEMTGLVAFLRTLASPIPRNAPPALSRKSVQTTDGQTLTGTVLNEGMSDLQLRTDDKKIHLLRKTGDRYRAVTSQVDWPTYHGDPSGNRYSKLTQIDKTNV